MYNRYVPQPDGSFCRRQFPETPHWEPERQHNSHPEPVQQPESPRETSRPSVTQPDRCKHCHGCQKKPHPSNSEPACANSLLSQLLPKDFDTGDLMVILLLLLMAGDCPENQSNALLTLALYLFL